MNQKITKTEFKKWHDNLLNAYAELTVPDSTLFQSETARKEWVELGSLTSLYTKYGVIQATITGLIGLDSLVLNKDTPYKDFDGQTFNQWRKEIGKRIKEHCIANGYYKPGSSPDPAQLKEKLKKTVEILLDSQKLAKYLPYATSEEDEVLSETAYYLRGIKKIIGEETNDLDKETNSETSFFIEDLVERTNKKERKEYY